MQLGFLRRKVASVDNTLYRTPFTLRGRAQPEAPTSGHALTHPDRSPGPFSFRRAAHVAFFFLHLAHRFFVAVRIRLRPSSHNKDGSPEGRPYSTHACIAPDQLNNGSFTP